MPSPFPGMDPYLEADLWPDFHWAFRGEISSWLNATLPAPYYSRLWYPFVEVRDSSRNHKLITMIGIVSPSSKHAGPDREAYDRKQQEVLSSDANLVEIDLLRHGRRLLPMDALIYLDQLGPAADYVVSVDRAWERGKAKPPYRLYPVPLREQLPCIEVPLKQEEAEPLLDLQFVFQRAFDGGPYLRGAVDYSQPPDPALRDEDVPWAEARLRSRVG